MALTISTGLSGGTVGGTVLGVITPKGAAGTVTYSVQSGSLAPGLTLNPNTGVISGTPTSATPSTAVIQATDGVTTATATVSTNPRSASQLPPGISLTALGQIPQHWDPQWFAWLVNSQLQYADVRNAISGTGIAIGSGINGTAAATISLTAQASSAQISGAGLSVLGNSANTTGTFSDIVAPAIAGYTLQVDPTATFLEWAAVPTSAGANPTAVVGLAAVNGVATTFMRSDGAPALDQTIAPTWTGSHIWSKATEVLLSAAGLMATFSDGTQSAIIESASGNMYFGPAVAGVKLNFQTGAGGVVAMTIGTDQGITVGSPTGGDQGAGTLNAAGLYVNGVAVGSGGSNVQVFTQAGGASQTYNVPASAKVVRVYCIGGGGGGGGGAKIASGTNSGGGAGGGGGGASWADFDATALGSSQTIVFSNASTGGNGAAATTVTGSGAAGTAGSNATFGSPALLIAFGGVNGGGGVSGGGGVGGNGGLGIYQTGLAGGSGGTSSAGSVGQAWGTTTLSATGFSPGAGGGGGATSAAGAASAGATGSTTSVSNFSSITPGAAGTSGGGGGGNGPAHTGFAVAQSGGGGGGSGTGATNGGKGGNGVSYGTGGGGGGAAQSTANGGAGGNGGPAAVICIAW